MVPICTEANEATQTHCYNPVAPAYPVWAYYAHGRQRRCQDDPVSLPSGRLEQTTRSSPHHVAQHRPTGSETTPPYAPRSSKFGSELPSVEDDVNVWCYAIVRVACQKRRRLLHLDKSVLKSPAMIHGILLISAYSSELSSREWNVLIQWPGYKVVETQCSKHYKLTGI